MIFEINQLYNSKNNDEIYDVAIKTENIGRFVVSDKHKNIMFDINHAFINDIVKNIATTINAIFNKPVEIRSATRQMLVNGFNDYNAVRDVYVLMHTKRDKYNAQSFRCFNDRIGTVYKDKKNITFNATFELSDYFSDMAIRGTYMLTKYYKQDIKLNVEGRSYTVTSKTPLSQIAMMYKDKTSPCYHNGKIVGTYEYTEYGITYHPGYNVPVPQSINGALFLKSVSGKSMAFIYPNNEYLTLLKLFFRERNKIKRTQKQRSK